MTPVDLSDKLGHSEAQVLPLLARGANYPCAAVTKGVALRRSPGVLPAGSADELDLSAILIPAQAKDPSGENGFDPRM